MASGRYVGSRFRRSSSLARSICNLPSVALYLRSKSSSRGSVEATADGGLRARANMLSTADDLRRMRHGARELAQLLLSDDVLALCEACDEPTTMGRTDILAPEAVLALDDDALDEWMRANASDGIHVSSSAARVPRNSRNTSLI